ncbi:Hypothetical predicted protein [Olea europaea subsp. europaea]|uniref:PWWP domain-containing protein n=1 Tax=Olea europaea subsp. europaea TaxID=158383 RepID=A0A8S0RHM3_OLEEU|nr:Hypothetical predicted protein [Olea europaea subsp. europaea]
MGRSAHDNKKAIDESVGGLVWVQRQNGSWWPGRILSPDKLPETILPVPRAGTPIQLLGREEASLIVNMGRSAHDNKKAIDESVGGLVWVQRQNGSWWPGRILSPDKLPETILPVPRAGTPIQLLGREEASLYVPL